MQSGTLFMSAYSAVWNTIYAGLQCSLEHHLQCGLEDYFKFAHTYNTVSNTI